MILVIGAKGMLGRDLVPLLSGEVHGVDVESIDITSLLSVQEVLGQYRPRVVINAAAYTDVDGCETERERAMQVNGEGVGFLAMVTRDLGAKLVQVSTDYVFDGGKGTPYEEYDAPHPLSVYGESKYAGELNAALNPDHLIVRTQWLYGLHGKNFVETMLRLATEKKELAVVNDQVGSPTWTVHLSLAIKALIEKDCRGIFHAANSGFCSWNEFAREIFVAAGVNITVNPLATSELGRPAPRPLYSTLDCGKLVAATGFCPPSWQDALHNYLNARRGK